MVTDNKIDETLFTIGKSQLFADFLSQIGAFPGMAVEMDFSPVVCSFSPRLSNVMQQNCIFKQHGFFFIKILPDLDGSVRQNLGRIVEYGFKMVISFHCMFKHIIIMMAVLKAFF